MASSGYSEEVLDYVLGACVDAVSVSDCPPQRAHKFVNSSNKPFGRCCEQGIPRPTLNFGGTDHLFISLLTVLVIPRFENLFDGALRPQFWRALGIARGSSSQFRSPNKF